MNLKMWSRKHVFMQEAEAEGSAGGGQGAEGAAVNPGSADQGAAAPATQTTTQSTTPPAAAEAGTETTETRIPEKFRVTGADGKIDTDASLAKWAESHGNLEKRMGAGESPPKTAAEYQVTVPEQFKEHWAADHPEFKEFAEQAHAAGLTQAQFGLFMNKYFEIIPAVAQGAQELNEEAARTALRESWPNDDAYEQGIRDANLVVTRLSEISGIPMDQAQNSGLFVNPVFIQMMAALAPEFREDTPASDGKGMTTGDDIASLMAHPAYSDSKHAQHAAVSAKVRAFYDRKHGGTPIL